MLWVPKVIHQQIHECARTKDFDRWLNTFRLLGPLFYLNHNPRYLFIWFEVLDQWKLSSEFVRDAIRQAFALDGVHHPIFADMFVEKFNKHIKKTVPNYLGDSMVGALKRACVTANSTFMQESMKPAHDFQHWERTRLRKKLSNFQIVYKWMLRYNLRDEILGSQPSFEASFPEPERNTDFNLQWTALIRSDLECNTKRADEFLLKKFQQHYAIGAPLKYSITLNDESWKLGEHNSRRLQRHGIDK